jgi:ABC-type oligopeptide transport system substrate-binding subunit
MKKNIRAISCVAVGVVAFGFSSCKERAGTQSENENEPYTENNSHTPVPPSPDNQTDNRSGEDKNPVEPEGPATAEPPGTGSRSDYIPSTR